MERIVKKCQDSFEPSQIFECGQCFRWNQEEDGSYTGIIRKSIVNVLKSGNDIIFTGETNENFEKLINDYFDLDTDYNEFKTKLRGIDKYLDKAIDYGSGIRILNQDLFETIISFIISANNNIPRIKKIIENICKSYGKAIKFNGKTYYSFPDAKELSKASISDLKNLGTGFRDIRIFNTTKMILNGDVNLDELKRINNTIDMKNELLKLDGVGPKVADCILLFSLKRFDVFPIDVWVRRVMNELYFKFSDEKNLSNKEINTFAEEKFLGLSGLAQQYLFYWRRESKGE